MDRMPKCGLRRDGFFWAWAETLSMDKNSNFAASKSDGMKNLTKIRRDVNCFSASDALIKVSFITFVV